MVREGIRKYSYTILLTLSFLLAAAAWKLGYVTMQENEIIFEVPGLAEFGIGQQGQESGIAGVYPKPLLWKPPEMAEEEQKEEPPKPVSPVMYTADAAWFDDALFIGDSRTVGLHEYGNLGNAEVVADSGMSVYKLFGKEFTLSTGEKGTLEELLAGHRFGKIYLMLGINELGYDFDRTVSRYQDAVERIQKLQPDALIFLQANLHIAKAKSEESPIYNNENIDRFNAAVEALTDEKVRFYLDVNELFDDEEGNLSDEYTVDQAHVLGKYYSDWVNWILKHAIKFE